MRESLWRMTREGAFEVVKKAVISARIKERLQSERWKPLIQAEYWYIKDTGLIGKNKWEGDRIDIARLDVGNAFRTRKEAEQARERIREVLINFHKNHE